MGEVGKQITADGDTTRVHVTKDGDETREEGKNAWTNVSSQAKKILEELEKLKTSPPTPATPTPPPATAPVATP